MIFSQLMEPLLQMKSLTDEQAEELMSFLTGGEATDAQVAAILTALVVKGCSGEELASFARVLRERATRLQTDGELVDTCGTGGGRASFNISTAAAIVAAAAGARIAKHGNRAVTSSCGSADVLETLGVTLADDPVRLAKCLEEVGIVFLFAPSHHPAMKHVGPARRDLGFRTVFNQLGPLANPAGASRQLVGVYGATLLRPMAEALDLLGTARALVVHGDDGLDEISPCGRSFVAKVCEGEVEMVVMKPESFGLQPLPEASLEPGHSREENAAILREAITDVDSLRSAVILPSAAAAIWLAGLQPDWKSAASLAKETIASGRAAEKLEQLVEVSRRP